MKAISNGLRKVTIPVEVKILIDVQSESETLYLKIYLS